MCPVRVEPFLKKKSVLLSFQMQNPEMCKIESKYHVHECLSVPVTQKCQGRGHGLRLKTFFLKLPGHDLVLRCIIHPYAPSPSSSSSD